MPRRQLADELLSLRLQPCLLQIEEALGGVRPRRAIGFVLEMGVSQPQTAGLVTWLDSHFVLYRGMRDAGKWAALLPR